ncbi:MAG: hypothetical protein ACLFRT_10685 [Actinomycetota bacterium]
MSEVLLLAGLAGVTSSMGTTLGGMGGAVILAWLIFRWWQESDWRLVGPASP